MGGDEKCCLSNDMDGDTKYVPKDGSENKGAKDGVL